MALVGGATLLASAVFCLLFVVLASGVFFDRRARLSGLLATCVGVCIVGLMVAVRSLWRSTLSAEQKQVWWVRFFFFGPIAAGYYLLAAKASAGDPRSTTRSPWLEQVMGPLFAGMLLWVCAINIAGVTVSGTSPWWFGVSAPALFLVDALRTAGRRRRASWVTAIAVATAFNAERLRLPSAIAPVVLVSSALYLLWDWRDVRVSFGWLSPHVAWMAMVMLLIVGLVVFLPEWLRLLGVPVV